ncbi:MAG: helix-turn-helix domain-containing protein [Planctomycetota bacterium]
MPRLCPDSRSDIAVYVPLPPNLPQGRDQLLVQTPAGPPKAPTLPRGLHSIKDSARYLGISPWTLREMIWRNDLPYVKIGRQQFLDIRDLDQFIEQAKVRGK